TVSLIAASLGIQVKSWQDLTDADKRRIERAHLLLVMYNAMQPGVFALSGWDLVGAATLPKSAVENLLADGGTRWINRGAYDLLGIQPGAPRAASGLPRAVALYGSLPEQLRAPDSFAMQLKKMLDVRVRYRINEGEQLEAPAVRSPGLLVMVTRLPA